MQKAIKSIICAFIMDHITTAYTVFNMWVLSHIGWVMLCVIFRWLFDQRNTRFLNNKSSLRFTSMKSEYQWHIRDKCCRGVCTKHQPPLFSSSQQILPHVCLLFHKHRGYARQMGPQSGPRETREQSENHPEQTTRPSWRCHHAYGAVRGCRCGPDEGHGVCSGVCVCVYGGGACSLNVEQTTSPVITV